MDLKLRPVPIGYVYGRPVWPFAGAEGEGEGEGAGAQGGSGSTGGAQSGGASEGSTTGGQAGEGDGERPADKDTVSRDEFERLRTQLSAADKKREEAEKRAKEFEDRDKTELDKATERAVTAEKERDALREEIQSLKLNQAMLSDSKFGADKWHDVDDVLTRLNRAVKDGSVEVSEDGAVKGVSTFLEKLAKDKKYLLKTPAQGAGGGASGEAANRDRREGAGAGDGEGKPKVSAERKKALAEQYPSLRR